jgi:hypothetical protein
LAAVGAFGLLALAGCDEGRASRGEGLCWIAQGRGRERLLAVEIPNLETCGARLEVIHLEERRTVTGSYGGVGILVDDGGIFARAPNGPSALLFDPASRRVLDHDILKLLALRQRASGPTTPSD